MRHYEISHREREDEAEWYEHNFGVDEYAPADIWGNRLPVDPDDPYIESVHLGPMRCGRCAFELRVEDEGGCPECGSMEVEAA